MNEREIWEGLGEVIFVLSQDLGQVCPSWRLHMVSPSIY